MSRDTQFSALLDKYSHFLTEPKDREDLLQIGQSLFGSESQNLEYIPSIALLSSKETELSTNAPIIQVKSKPVQSKTRHGHQDSTQGISADMVSEEILCVQDRNSLLLARKKSLENQRNGMLNDFGRLMEQSVQQKVHLKMEMQKLKAELAEALSRSRPEAKADVDGKSKPIMEELAELNQQVLMRINSFKMAVSNGTTEYERAVLNRYKPQMEKILGQIYAYSEYLPVSVVLEKFNSTSDGIEKDLRDIETELKSEHERNDQLQKEANQLGSQVAEQQEEVNRLKNQNTQLQKEISVLSNIAEKEIATMSEKYKELLAQCDESGAAPTSARAIFATAGCQKRALRKSPSRKAVLHPSFDVPQVPPVEHFVEIQRATLLEKINHQQSQ